MGDSRARSVRAALVHVGRPAPDPATVVAEARLRAILDEVTALDLEVETLSAALADFARAYERALGDAFRDVHAAERLVRRIQALEDWLAALADGLRGSHAPPASARRSAVASSGAVAAAARAARAALAPDEAPEDPEAADDADEGEGEDTVLEPEELALKRLHRALARLLHPDLARDDGARERLGDLMARVNAAYEAGDLATLELMSERLGAGELDGEVSPEERRAHLERRTAALERIRAALGRERERLLRSDTARLLAESRRRTQAGGDLLEETRAELAEEARAAYADALLRLGRVGTAAREVARARTAVMTKIVRRGPTGVRRAFDPLAEGGLVRMGAARLERRRATPAARELARRLEDAAQAAPEEAALTLLAFYAEEAGGRPPEAIARAEGWAATWERLRGALPEAPELPRLLAHLPLHLVLGARVHGEEIVAGVQLAEPELLAGVRIALERDRVAGLAREVLAALGPEEACDACGARGPARHLLRTRGLDERHGVVCAGCGAILRSYWRYGELDGLEALAPHALRLGLVAEVTVQLAGTTLGFQMLPAERERLTAGGLLRRFADLYLAPYEVTLPPDASSVVSARGGPLQASAPLPLRARLRLALEPSVTTAEALVDLLRHRIERRFRP